MVHGLGHSVLWNESYGGRTIFMYGNVKLTLTFRKSGKEKGDCSLSDSSLFPFLFDLIPCPTSRCHLCSVGLPYPMIPLWKHSHIEEPDVTHLGDLIFR